MPSLIGMMMSVQRIMTGSVEPGEESIVYQLTLSSPLSGVVLMKIKNYKEQLSQILCTHDLGSKIELLNRADSIVLYDDAGISLISYMLQVVLTGARTVRIHSDGTCVSVLLVYW